MTNDINARRCAHASWQFLLVFAWQSAWTSWFVQGPCFWHSLDISYSSKKPLDSAVVHSSKSKDHSLTFVNKHWCHPVCSRSILSKESHCKHRWGLDSKMWGLWVKICAYSKKKKKKKKIIWSYLLLLILVYSLYPPNQMVQWPWVDMLSSLGCPPYLLQVFWWPQTYQSAKTLIQLWNKRDKIYLNYSCFRWYSDPEWTRFLFWSVLHIFFRCFGDLKHTRVPKPWSNFGIKETKYSWIIYVSDGTWPWVDRLSSLWCLLYLLQVSWWPQTYQSAKTLI